MGFWRNTSQNYQTVKGRKSAYLSWLDWSQTLIMYFSKIQPHFQLHLFASGLQIAKSQSARPERSCPYWRTRAQSELLSSHIPLILISSTAAASLPTPSFPASILPSESFLPLPLCAPPSSRFHPSAPHPSHRYWCALPIRRRGGEQIWVPSACETLSTGCNYDGWSHFQRSLSPRGRSPSTLPSSLNDFLIECTPKPERPVAATATNQ